MLSLRHRLTREAAGAVLALVWGFGALAWAGTAWHLYASDRSAAMQLSLKFLQEPTEPIRPGRLEHGERLAEFRRTTDPQIWIRQGSQFLTSPNVLQHASPPKPGLHGVGGPNPLVVVETGTSYHVWVAWPLAPDWDILLDLATVLAGSGILAGGLGFWLANWATRRMLVPVDQMVAEVSSMVLMRRPEPLSVWSDADDEFHRLSHVLNQLLQFLSDQAMRERQMLAQAAHELRTPLQVLQGNLEIMASAEETETALRQESLEQSRLVTQRLIRMVTDLLMLERAVHPRMQIPDVLDLAPLVGTVAQDARALASLNRLTVLDHIVSTEVQAVAWSVERALWAVLDNALKYTPPEGTIRLEVWQEVQFAGVRIVDSGPGIAAQDLPRIFDRFYRGAYSPKVPGSGLGLSLAKALVERDGGFIRVISQPGEGTTVELAWVRATSPS